MKTLFTQEENQALLNRINSLNPQSEAQWGKMTVGQMLAHCTVAYRILINDEKPRLNFLMRFMMKNIFKSAMVNDVPYKQNVPTAPWFVVSDNRNFEEERDGLIQSMLKIHNNPSSYFEGKKHYALGKLNAGEWKSLLFKHIDHHLRQFNL